MALKAQMLGRPAVMRRLNDLVPDAEAELATAQLAVAREAADKIRARAPVDEGDYQASVQGDRIANRPGQTRVVGGSPTKDPNATGVFADFRWRFLEFGTKAHAIVPKSSQLLRFRGADGRFVSAKKVEHPGAAAKPHIFPTWRAYRKTALRKMAHAVNKAVRRARGK